MHTDLGLCCLISYCKEKEKNKFNCTKRITTFVNKKIKDGKYFREKCPNMLVTNLTKAAAANG